MSRSLNLRPGSNLFGFTWNCIQCFKIYAGVQLKPVFVGFETRFKFIKFGLWLHMKWVNNFFLLSSSSKLLSSTCKISIISVIYVTSWRARRCPWKKKWRKKFELFSAFATHERPQKLFGRLVCYYIDYKTSETTVRNYTICFFIILIPCNFFA